MPIFASKAVGETIPLIFNFEERLLFGEAVNGASVAIVVMSGTDANPAAMLVGGPTFDATTVTQDVTGGIVGTLYSAVCTATGTLSHNYVLAGSLAVLADTGGLGDSQ